MKVLLYSENQKLIGKSGLGKAIKHQIMALEKEGVLYTLNPRDDYDILHVNTYFLKSYLLVKKAKKAGKKIVYHAHSTEEDYKDGFILAKQTSKLFKKWLIKCYKNADVIITPSTYSKSLLKNYQGLENKKIYAVSNGVDLSFFKKDESLRKKFREKYGYKDDDEVIFSIGLYIERKGITDFVSLAKRFPDKKFIWFGYSSLKIATKPVRKAVNTKLDNLTFAGYVEKDVIKQAMNGADLFIFPTKEETEGIPIIEALASKCPVIVRDIKVFDYLRDKKDVYKAKDENDFAKLIDLFFKGKLKDLSENGYKVVKERDVKVVGKKLKKIYEDLWHSKN